MVSPDAAAEQTQLFKVGALRQALFPEISKRTREAAGKCCREMLAQTGSLVALLAEAQPVLLNLTKQQPLGDGRLCQFVGTSAVT